MAHTTTAHGDHGGTKEIWKVFWILLVLTVVELGFGFLMMGWPEQSFKRHVVKGIIIILMLAKAFYIIAYFMHLKPEIKTLVLSISIPMLLFIWFITAFLHDGNAYRDLKNTYDPYYKEITTTPVDKEKAAHEHGKDAVRPTDLK